MLAELFDKFCSTLGKDCFALVDFTHWLNRRGKLCSDVSARNVIVQSGKVWEASEDFFYKEAR